MDQPSGQSLVKTFSLHFKGLCNWLGLLAYLLTYLPCASKVERARFENYLVQDQSLEKLR